MFFGAVDGGSGVVLKCVRVCTSVCFYGPGDAAGCQSTGTRFD